MKGSGRSDLRPRVPSQATTERLGLGLTLSLNPRSDTLLLLTCFGLWKFEKMLVCDIGSHSKDLQLCVWLRWIRGYSLDIIPLPSMA